MILLELQRATEPQPGAVDQQMHGIGARHWTQQPQRLGSPAQGGMIGDGEIESEQADDRPDQTLGLTQGKVE